MSYQIARSNMITQQLRTGDVLNKTILSLYESILREEFVPEVFKEFAYADIQIQLSHSQRMMTPLEEGLLLQSLDLKGHETVLEVGTGSGFLTALLSRLCKQVISVDYYADFTASASHKLAQHQCTNVTCITGDASRGWLEKAPYDVILFTGALEKLTETHRLQLLPGGKLFAIVGQAPVMQGQLHTLQQNNSWQTTVLFETNLPALINPLKKQDFVF